jgi:gamma-tubulin complex component 3
MSYLFFSIWSNQMEDSRRLLRRNGPALTEMTYLLHLSQVITTEMVHFIGQLQYYITFEVLECSWDVLIKKVGPGGR